MALRLGLRPISANLFIDVFRAAPYSPGMATVNAAQEDWNVLVSFFPSNWKQLAQETQALKGLRQDKSAENYLRVLLLHLGCGFSLRETVARAKQSRLADLSDVALLKRLRKSKEWLHSLCCALFQERGLNLDLTTKHSLRLMDSTTVKEPGQTGSLWRIHYSLEFPSLACDHFKLTATEGEGTGESLSQYPIKAGDHILADRGYCRAKDFHFAAQQKAWAIIRLNPQSIRLETRPGQLFPLLDRLELLAQSGPIRQWKVWLPQEGSRPLAARLCVIRKSRPAIELALKKLRRRASRQGRKLEPETLIYAQYVMVLTTFPESEFPAEAVLEHYRFRWQVELVFKRLKQIAQLGHLPKSDEQSSQAWLYGKLFVALLTNKLVERARAFSPWGYALPNATEPLA